MSPHGGNGRLHGCDRCEMPAHVYRLEGDVRVLHNEGASMLAEFRALCDRTSEHQSAIAAEIMRFSGLFAEQLSRLSTAVDRLERAAGK